MWLRRWFVNNFSTYLLEQSFDKFKEEIETDVKTKLVDYQAEIARLQVEILKLSTSVTDTFTRNFNKVDETLMCLRDDMTNLQLQYKTERDALVDEIKAMPDSLDYVNHRFQVVFSKLDGIEEHLKMKTENISEILAKRFHEEQKKAVNLPKEMAEKVNEVVEKVGKKRKKESKDGDRN